MEKKVLDKNTIIDEAKSKWNSKSAANKIRAGSKYKHLFERYGFKENSWDSEFDDLSKRQQNIIIKGELIRLYDSLPNIDKTNIMKYFGLSSFSSKWYRLSGNDKKILLNYVIR